jgi:hypothetical protein
LEETKSQLAKMTKANTSKDAEIAALMELLNFANGKMAKQADENRITKEKLVDVESKFAKVAAELQKLN